MAVAESAPLSSDALALLAPWRGPCGGLPPYDHATPAALAEALPQAVAERRHAVRAIAENHEPSTFGNTVAALENSARAMRDLHALAMSVATTASVGEMPAVAQRLAPMVPALELEIAHDRTLFGRVDAVWQARHATGLDAQQQADQLILQPVGFAFVFGSKFREPLGMCLAFSCIGADAIDHPAPGISFGQQCFAGFVFLQQ